MEKVREEERVIYTPHWIESKIRPGCINGYCIEHDEVDCYQTIAGIINRDFSVEKYASKLNRTRGNEIKNYGEGMSCAGAAKRGMCFSTFSKYSKGR
jgi:hypothetical protein